MATRQPRQEDRKSPLDDLNLSDTAVFGFSWMLVMAVGLNRAGFAGGLLV